jgi:hypothetical protein
MRRGVTFAAPALTRAAPSSAALTLAVSRPAAAARTYVNPFDPVCTMFMCGWVTCTFAAWGNNIFALNKHGLYRNHMMQIDGSILPEYNRLAQFIGACFGFGYYWFIVGPMKYRHSDIEKWSKRIGPF